MPKPVDSLEKTVKQRGPLHRRLTERRALVGLLQLRPNSLLVETATPCDYDFLILDAEHGAFGEGDYAQTLKALAATDVLAFVRLGGHDTQAARQYLDMGADGIVVPHVSTVEEARLFVDAMMDHESASLIVLLESALGASNAEEILAIDGVAGAFVGPRDLIMDLGCPDDYSDSAYVRALSRIERAAAVTGKALGTVPHGEHSLAALHARGHRLFVLGTDQSLLHEAMSAQATKARSSLATCEPRIASSP